MRLARLWCGHTHLRPASNASVSAAQLAALFHVQVRGAGAWLRPKFWLPICAAQAAQFPVFCLSITSPLCCNLVALFAITLQPLVLLCGIPIVWRGTALTNLRHCASTGAPSRGACPAPKIPTEKRGLPLKINVAMKHQCQSESLQQ